MKRIVYNRIAYTENGIKLVWDDSESQKHKVPDIPQIRKF